MLALSAHSFKRTATSVVLVMLCSTVTTILILLPLPIVYKIGFLMFVVLVMVFFINTLYAMMIFLLIRPAIEPMINVQIIPGVPTVGILSLWITGFFIFKYFVDRSYTIAVPNIGILFLMIPFSLFSMFNSSDIIVSVAHLLRFIGWISVYILMYNLVKTRNDVKKVMMALILSAVIPLIIGYYQLFTGTGWYEELRKIRRLSSVFGQPDTCGLFFSIIFFITLSLFMQTKELRRRIIFLLAMSSILVIIVYTYHRGSQYGMMLGILTMSFFYKKILKIVIPLIFLVCIVFYSEISNRIIDLFVVPEYTTGSSLDSRFFLWGLVLNLMQEHPIIGWGMGTADQVIKNKYSILAMPHNDYLRLAVEIGIFGLLLYTSFIIWELRYYLLQTITNTDKDINGIVFGLVVFYAFVSFGQNNFYNVNNMSVLFSMLAISKKLNLIQSKNRIHEGLSVK